MVNPGTNQVARMPWDLSKARIRRAPIRPNSPRESAVGLVMPRAMKPDCVSKSKLRQTMWRGTLPSRNVDTHASGIAKSNVVNSVIAGLDPAIHSLRKKFLRRMMDPRVKPAGDACGCGMLHQADRNVF